MSDEIVSSICFDKQGLIPIITQDADTKEVLMLAYANREALEKTITLKQAHYYSRSRGELWHKGATSGNFQHIIDIRYDCDCDAVLYIVRQDGAACHTGEYSCFYRSMLSHFSDTAFGGSPDAMNASQDAMNASQDAMNGILLCKLQSVISNRKANPMEGSYTNYLFDKGIDKILKKVGEECAEVIIAAKNGSKTETTYETADLLYHMTVLLTEMGLKWPDIMAELKDRSG